MDSSMTTHVSGLQYSIYISMIFMSETMILYSKRYFYSLLFYTVLAYVVCDKYIYANNMR